jgi:hypothetical protein
MPSYGISAPNSPLFGTRVRPLYARDPHPRRATGRRALTPSIPVVLGHQYIGTVSNWSARSRRSATKAHPGEGGKVSPADEALISLGADLVK